MNAFNAEIDERIISDNTSNLDQILLYGNENYNHQKDFVIYYKVLIWHAPVINYFYVK